LVALKSGKQQINQIRRFSSILQTPDSVITHKLGTSMANSSVMLILNARLAEGRLSFDFPE
jgi:hypothetical protein